MLRLFGVKEPDPEDPLPLSVANYIRECAQIDFYPSIVCLSPTADGYVCSDSQLERNFSNF